MDQIKLLKVHFLPKDLEEGLLYVSEEFGVAGHLCPCGCRAKIITPLGPIEWSYKETDEKATLSPSIGNWQIPCKSHYWIRGGQIEWSTLWSNDEIIAGQQEENERRKIFFNDLQKNPRKSIIQSFLEWVLK